jgi:hypothetical protein
MRDFILQNSLADCIANSTGQPLEALFSGTATIDIPSRNEHSSDDLQFRILLNGGRTVITLVSFPTITSIVHTPLGDDTVTVTRTSGGTGAYASGHIVLPLGLHFAHSNIFFSDSDLSITLTTDPPGSPVTPEPFGAVTVVGSGIFQGGVLGGSPTFLRGASLRITQGGAVHPCKRRVKTRTPPTKAGLPGTLYSRFPGDIV